MATTDSLRLPHWRSWDWPLLSVLVVAAIVGAGATTFALPVTTPTTIASPVVKVEIGKGHGSGVYIGNGLYLTAAHVTAQDGPLTLKTNTGASFGAERLWASPEYDVALIYADPGNREQKAAPLVCKDAKEGQSVRVEGNPASFDFVTTRGRIANAKATKVDRWVSAQVVDMTIVQGQSGGGVFDDDGNIVGLAVGVATMPMPTTTEGTLAASLTGLGIIVPASAVCKLLGRV